MILLIEDRLEAAAKHRKTGQVENAALLYESVLDHSPGHVETLQALAEIRLETGDVEKALVLARQAVLRGATAETLVLLAKTALATNNREEAINAVEEALSIDPGHANACQLRADFLLQSGDVEQAEALLKAALSRRPDDPGLLAGLAGFYGTFKQGRPALALAQEALARAPDKPEYLALMGRTLADMGDHEKALDFLTRAHLAAPSNPLLMIYLAGSQASLGFLSEARTLAKRTTTMFPDLLAGWLVLIQIETYQGEQKKAFEDFLQRVRQHKDKTGALIALAVAYRSVGAADKALQLLQPFLRDNDNIDSQQRGQALTIARDCVLSTGELEMLGTTLSGVDLHAALGLPQPGPEQNDTAALIDAFETRDVVIESGLSNLEAIVLTRFLHRRKADTPVRKIFGPSHLRQVLDLVGETGFVPYDEPGMADHGKDGARPVPLSAAFQLSTVLLRQYQGACPYIVASDTRRLRWREALADMPRPLVALAWDPTRPGLLLQDYQPLFDNIQGTFISIVWDEARHQLKSFPDIIDAGTHFTSFADLAAVLAETELLIGPDGVPLHVAGAMGRPAALLCQPAPAWYWHSDEGRATWYPAVHVVKTTAFGNWADLMPAITPQLIDIVNAAHSDDGAAPVDAIGNPRRMSDMPPATNTREAGAPDP
jgi:tetratricopeptide (TPR) repeat protein